MSNSLNTPPLTPQSAIFGFINRKENFLILNYLFFIFNYNSRSSAKLNIEYLKTIIYKTFEVKRQEEENNNILTNGNHTYNLLVQRV